MLTEKTLNLKTKASKTKRTPSKGIRRCRGLGRCGADRAAEPSRTRLEARRRQGPESNGARGNDGYGFPDSTGAASPGPGDTPPSGRAQSVCPPAEARLGASGAGRL